MIISHIGTQHEWQLARAQFPMEIMCSGAAQQENLLFPYPEFAAKLLNGDSFLSRTGLGEVWCWDVTFLPAQVRGRWYYPSGFARSDKQTATTAASTIGRIVTVSGTLTG
jgi:hypothetical protein